MELLIFLILGAVAGVIAGLFGLGGGILFTPILFIVFTRAGISNPVVLAIATSLFCTFIASAGSTIRQYHQDNFYLKDGLKVGVMGAAGVSIGKQVITSPYYSQEVFVIFFSLLLLYVAYMFYLRGSKQKSDPVRNDITISLKESFVTGGLGGFVAALAGIGGGAVMVPIMNLYYRKDFQKAVSISSLAIVLISLSGWIQLSLADESVQTLTAFHAGYVDFGSALPLAVGGFLGGFAGALLNLKIKRQYLQYAFAILAIGIAIKLIIEVF